MKSTAVCIIQNKVKGILDKQGTKEITGKTKFANAVVKVYSELGEAQLFPDIQVDENGKFKFHAEKLVSDYKTEKHWQLRSS